jgi:hypothetical protein
VPVALSAGVTIKGNRHQIGSPSDASRQLSAPLLGGTNAAPILNATIENLSVYVNIPIIGEDFVGGLARTVSGATILNVSVSGMIYQNGTYVGGLVGRATGTSTFDGCTNYATVTGLRAVGGIAGIAGRMGVNPHSTTASGAPIFRSCTNAGEVRSTKTGNGGTSEAGNDTHTGGIVGNIAGGQIIGCTNSGAISSTFTHVAGIAGSADKTDIYKCINSGLVTGVRYRIAGIAGLLTNAQSSIRHCTNTGNIRAIKIGDNTSAIDIAGIVGTLTTAGNVVDRCTNKGSVVIQDEAFSCTHVGGICGHQNKGTLITNCTNKGSIGGTSNIGGIVGHSIAEDVRSFVVGNTNKADVIASGTYIGGIAGYANSNVTISNNMMNSAQSSVRGTNAVGGIVGYVVNAGTVPTDQTIVAENSVNALSIQSTNGTGAGIHRIVGRYDNNAGSSLIIYNNYANSSLRLTGDNTSVYIYDHDTMSTTESGAQYSDNIVQTNDPDYGANRYNGANKSFPVKYTGGCSLLELGSVASDGLIPLKLC